MMDCLVDTHVISDVLTRDKHWYDWSLEELACPDRQLLLNPIIYAELCCRAESSEEIDQYLELLRLMYVEIPRPALHLAAQAFLFYRKRGGIKTSPLPDFFIGAHATILNGPILTRDQAHYRSYFPDVTLISPG